VARQIAHDPVEEEAMTDQIERELLLPASPQQVWEVIVRPGFLAEDVQLDLTPGGEARFTDGDRVRQGWVEEAEPPGDGQSGHLADGEPGRLAFWWSADGEPASRVELTLDPDDGGRTRLRVVEARPLEVLDVIGLPLPGAGGSAPGPAMLATA
jgi:uncharacterized protein YndB with AHSA1/START domain